MAAFFQAAASGPYGGAVRCQRQSLPLENRSAAIAGDRPDDPVAGGSPSAEDKLVAALLAEHERVRSAPMTRGLVAWIRAALKSREEAEWSIFPLTGRDGAASHDACRCETRANPIGRVIRAA
jgi:hypothetical protein